MKRNKTKRQSERLEKKLRRQDPQPKPTAKDFLSTGSTLLNLVLTGNPNWGYLKGHYYLLTGDSKSGKTWLALSALAEAANNSNFTNYRLIYDDVEHGALMDKGHFFGKKLSERIEPPAWTENTPEYSYILEDLYFNVWNALEGPIPFIYVIDSLDSLSSEQETAKFQERKKAREQDRETTGVMTDGKAKINSQDLRQLLSPLHKKKSIFIAIRQTRDRMGLGARFQPKTSSGGHAPGFYAGVELWSKVIGSIKRRIRNKDRQIGTYCEFRTKKNRLQGNDSTVVVPILRSTGIDDVGSCVDYLVDEKRWTKNKAGKIQAEDLDFTGSREQLIRHIERKDLERDVREFVTDVWEEIEEASFPKRKKRYE